MTDQPDRTIRAPWTSEQVTALNNFQQYGGMHPFTCGNDQHDVSVVLMAHRDGWHCSDPACGYRQDWAHAFMVDRGRAVSSAVPAPATDRICDLTPSDGDPENVRATPQAAPAGTTVEQYLGFVLDDLGAGGELADVPGVLREVLRLHTAELATQVADAVLRAAVLPAPADRAAVLREAADWFERDGRSVQQLFGHQAAAALRCMADEQDPTQDGCWCGHPKDQHWSGATTMTFPDGCHACRGWNGAHAYGQELPWLPEGDEPATEEQDAPPVEPHPTEADLRHALAVLDSFYGQDADAPAVGAPQPKEAVWCSAVALRVHHAGHDWTPQPGMNPVHCVGYPQPKEAGL